MMSFTTINKNPSTRELRVFSGLLIGFSVFVAWSVDRHFDSTAAAATVGIIGFIAGIVGLFVPSIARKIYIGWMYAVSPIAFVVSNTILAFVFFGVVWPIAILLRLKDRDSLRLKLHRDAPTYWLPRKQQTDPRRYFRQF